MGYPFRLALVILLAVLPAACSASSTPAVLSVTPSPSPTSPELDPALESTPIPARTLAAGQWNYLFYHPLLERVVLVNGGPDKGRAAGEPLELWTWDGLQWELLSADPAGPRWRNFAGAAFDTGRNVLVIHGGLQDMSNRMDDTWEWDGQSWRQFTASGPGFREGAMMAYDEARKTSILFGGANADFELFNDTWAWDGAAWTQVSTSGPSPRFPSTIVYDPAREEVLFFSGHFVSASDYIDYADFWQWDGRSWEEISLAGAAPSARNIAQMVYLPPNKEVILFGGGTDGRFLTDLWSWDGTAWTHFPEAGTPVRSGFGAAYDAARGRVVAFGGVGEPGGTAITDTWEWDAHGWRCAWGCK